MQMAKTTWSLNGSLLHRPKTTWSLNGGTCLIKYSQERGPWQQRASSTRMGVEPESRGSPCVKKLYPYGRRAWKQAQQASSTRMGVEPESRGTLMHELTVQMANETKRQDALGISADLALLTTWLHRARKRHKRALGISWNPLLVQLACRHWADPRRSQKANDRNIQNDLSYCWFWFCRTECCSQQIMHACDPELIALNILL